MKWDRKAGTISQSRRQLREKFQSQRGNQSTSPLSRSRVEELEKSTDGSHEAFSTAQQSRSRPTRRRDETPHHNFARQFSDNLPPLRTRNMKMSLFRAIPASERQSHNPAHFGYPTIGRPGPPDRSPCS